jgi:hypothetical protein
MNRPIVLLCALMALVGSILVTTDPAATAVPAAATATPNQTHPGSWKVLNCPGVNPIHEGMLPSGNVVMVAGSGYNGEVFNQNMADPTLKLFKAWIWNPTSGACPREIPLPQDKDLFCSGMVSLPNGRILFFGGTKKYGISGSRLYTPDYYNGIPDAYVFDEASESFTKVPNMSVGRWYGQAPVDGSGTPWVYSGLDENGALTNKVDKFNPATLTWSPGPATTFGVLPLYAGSVLLPSNNMAYTGTYFGDRNNQNPKAWNPRTGAATQAAIPGLLAPTCRDQGLTLKNASQVAVIGGGCGASATGQVSLLDVSQATLAFKNGPYLGYAAQHLCGAVLPDRSYFVSGGSVQNVTTRLEARRLGLGATAWQTLAKPTVPRLYHSTCLPLLDGRVATMGTNYRNGTVESRIEIYTPWYAQGQGLVRPQITSLSTLAAPLGARINATNSYASIKFATLTKMPTSTHSSDPNQLLWPVKNDWTAFGHVSFQLPTNGAVTPPGKYMLSLLDWRGVPTVSKVFTILPKVSVSASVAVGAGSPAAAVPCCCC